MNSCYVLSLISFGCLLTAFFQSFFQFLIGNANHITFILMTSICYLFTETLIIFFFVGTGVSIKEYAQEHQLKSHYHQDSIAIKRKVYPPQLINILLMIILFILVGAVDTLRFPRGLYQLYFVFCLGHYLFMKRIQNDCFKKNTQVVLDMSGIARKF